jgi:hypothetical protein
MGEGRSTVIQLMKIYVLARKRCRIRKECADKRM